MKEKLSVVLANQQLFPVHTFHFGLAAIAAFIIKNFSGIDLKIIEGENILNKILEAKPDIVGLTSDTMNYNNTIKLAKSISRAINSNPNPTLIVGGVHITAMPESLDRVFQVGVMGEGELTFLELLKIFKRDNKFSSPTLKKIKGIVFRDKGKIVSTGRRDLIKNIDSLPYPGRELVPMNEVYLKGQLNLFGVEKMATMMTSRGCPYKCVFCGSPVQWGSARFHSAEYVVSEIEFIVNKYKVDGIMFWDDLFIAPKDRLIKMATLIKKKKLEKKLTFFGYARANLITEEICQSLKSMNVKRLIFGLESGSDKILGFLKGNSVKVEDNKRALILCRKYGITTSSGFIVGTPGETVSDLRETYEFMRKYPLDNSQVYILTPYPGTKMWGIAEEQGLVSKKMNFGKLFVQLSPPSIFDYLRKDNKEIVKGRIFLNNEYKYNKEYLRLVFKMHKLAHFRNTVFYLKAIMKDLRLLEKILRKEIAMIFNQKKYQARKLL